MGMPQPLRNIYILFGENRVHYLSLTMLFQVLQKADPKIESDLQTTYWRKSCEGASRSNPCERQVGRNGIGQEALAWLLACVSQEWYQHLPCVAADSSCPWLLPWGLQAALSLRPPSIPRRDPGQLLVLSQ